MESKWGRLGLIVAATLGVSACAEGYGYSGVNVGYASAYGDPYYDDGYYGGGYYGAGYGGFGAPYYGWYNDFYYPGTGIYVYDRYRRPFRWNDNQRRYWEGRRGGYRNEQIRDNWGDFRRDVRRERRDYRGDLRDNRQAYRNGTINQEQFRQGRRDARQEFRNDVRQERRELRRENRQDRGFAPRPRVEGPRARVDGRVRATNGNTGLIRRSYNPRGGGGGGRRGRD
jgi:hypothetical protein